MKCNKCGTELESNALVCPFCGQVVPDEDRLLEQHGQAELTKEEFLNLPAMKFCRSNINTCGIALYILGAINVAWALYQQILPVDGIVYILLGLGIHLGRSRVCAILCIVASGINVIYMSMINGRLSGWFILFVSIYTVIYTFKYHNAWNKYKKDGTLPVEKS